MYSALHFIAVEVRDSAVVQALHVGGDGREFSLVLWQSVLGLFALDLVEEDALHFSLALQILAEQRLIAVFLHALGPHVQLACLPLDQILLVLNFIFNIGVVVLLASDVFDKWFVRVLQLLFADLVTFLRF